MVPCARPYDRLTPRRLLCRPDDRALVASAAPHHERGAVGVAHDRLRDAAHQRSPDAAEAPAADDHHPSPDLLGELHYLFVGTARAEVRLGHRAPGRADARGLLIGEPPRMRLEA
jgi:hypothetical protein